MTAVPETAEVARRNPNRVAAENDTRGATEPPLDCGLYGPPIRGIALADLQQLGNPRSRGSTSNAWSTASGTSG